MSFAAATIPTLASPPADENKMQFVVQHIQHGRHFFLGTFNCVTPELVEYMQQYTPSRFQFLSVETNKLSRLTDCTEVYVHLCGANVCLYERCVNQGESTLIRMHDFVLGVGSLTDLLVACEVHSPFLYLLK